MSKIFLASTFATLLCASLAAQAPQTQPQAQDPATSRVAPPATGAGSTTADPQTTRSAKPESIIVEGCITRGTAGRSTAGTTGTTAPAPTAFMLTSAMKPAGSTAMTTIASSYRLDAIDSKLSPHVGHKVEITGTVEPESASAPGGAAAMASPKLKVDNVKMIAATCTP